jgi:hypothetical protein
MHLNAEELVDIAEGTRLEASAAHLEACEECRAKLRDLRAMTAAVQEVDIPEPSPLFWNQLSSRVSQTVAEEGIGAGSARLKGSRPLTDVSDSFRDVLRGLSGSRSSFGARTFQASVAVAAGVLIAVALSSRAPAPVPGTPPAAVSVADANPDADLLGDLMPDDDAWLTLVASVTDDQDLEIVREAGLAPRGTAEHALAHMSEGELRELGRLLKEELARSGA